MKSGFGSKGSRKSSSEVGLRTYAEYFGSPESAFRSIIPYVVDNRIWTTLVPDSYSLQTSGSSTLAHRWLDINRANDSSFLTASADSSKPTVDTTNKLGNYPGLRFVGQRFVVSSAGFLDANQYKDVNYITHYRNNKSSATTEGWFADGSVLNATNNGGVFAQLSSNGLLRAGHFDAYASSNRIWQVINVSATTAITRLDREQILNFNYALNTTNRTLAINLKNSSATSLYSNTLLSSSISPTVTDIQWDAYFGNGFQKRYLVLPGSSLTGLATDMTLYTFIILKGPTTDDVLTRISQYLGSVYKART